MRLYVLLPVAADDLFKPEVGGGGLEFDFHGCINQRRMNLAYAFSVLAHEDYGNFG